MSVNKVSFDFERILRFRWFPWCRGPPGGSGPAGVRFPCVLGGGFKEPSPQSSAFRLVLQELLLFICSFRSCGGWGKTLIGGAQPGTHFVPLVCAYAWTG